MDCMLGQQETINREKEVTMKVRVVPTEVYSRIVGYYRPVQNWNRGKVEEFQQRKVIDPERAVAGVREKE
ncbi:MAG TPA: anaerobic ribonucleoside-triphosphate reductase [Candidatus Aminicenantes bacterium]|nr:anaerobic ribonucleoside-triphosphate reductase [Candidatus Aminicenantes bacterium]HPB55737.1 anaerobic ribonucleoside-triphosphate reductase [Candidatus Aminicenantes bacterium]HPS99393.1 anaerobic ribonucleoside-triphosphate reductase [Candidatus Aminicenantes bacterium]